MHSSPLASIGDRFTAQFIDGLAALTVAAIFLLANNALSLLFWFVAPLGWLLYILFCDALPGGQSLGKKFTGSAVVHVKTGRPCNFWQSFVRNLTLVVLGIFDWVFIMGEKRRRLGDYLAGTEVIRLAAQA